MSIESLECSRCCGMMKSAGDWLCDNCSQLLDRDPLLPWWGNFPGTDDAELEAQLTECRSDPLKGLGEAA